MTNTPMTLEALELKSWDALYKKDPANVIRLMSEKHVPPSISFRCPAVP